MANSKIAKGAETPLMQQYHAAKKQYPDALLLFRIGDFYETFGEDAILCSRTLGITLTARNNGGNDIELAGFPYHSLDTYMPRLIRAGLRVAICEQLEKPIAGKIVKRGITSVTTPGVTADDKILEQTKNNYLTALFLGKNNTAGVSFLDLSTGEFLVSEGTFSSVDNLLQSLQPSEIIFSKKQQNDIQEQVGEKYYTYGIEEWVFSHDYGREKLLSHFGTASLKGFGVEEMPLAQTAAGATLHYLSTTHNTQLQHINSLSRIQQNNYVWLDRFTIRNLELLNPLQENGLSLLHVLDKTLSPMGARLLKKWVVLPLKNQQRIAQRHDIVQFFLLNTAVKTETESLIRQIGDLERLISKVAMCRINPREVVQLGKAAGAIQELKLLLSSTNIPALLKIADQLTPLPSMQAEINRTLVAEPPVNLAKGNVIAESCDADLDDLRSTIKNAQQLLLEIQQREIEKTGIPSLKVSFNAVFGYYIEVTNKYRDHHTIPTTWIRKQTLANAERFITEELKVLEDKILGAEERILAIEERIYSALVLSLADFIQPIQQNAQVVAILDCLRSFADIAYRNGYQRPEINDSTNLHITEGRHPVIEQKLPVGEAYIPNSVALDTDEQQIMMITGPNMAGKSALLRQTALICLMAQIGSFVPAQKAVLGIVDKIFTRVGASDNISSGESTFMVEMNETANILNNISDRSLILLDEIGRGTSTYDGISIAWSIAEYLHENGYRPKTLFATHYHELNELAEKFERIKNYHIATKEVGQKVIFLRKLTEGGSEHSFGIHVAKMAGMPLAIVDRASEILMNLEQKHISSSTDTDLNPAIIKTAQNRQHNQQALRQMTPAMQLSIFETGNPTLQRIEEALESIDLNSSTPIEVMLKVAEWKKWLTN